MPPIKTAAQAATAVAKIESMMGSITAMSCDQLYELYEKNLELIKELIQTPKKVMGKVAMLAAYPFKRATKLLGDYSRIIDETMKALLSGFSLADIIRALNKMLECPFIADSIIGKLIADAIDALTKNEAIKKAEQIIAQFKASVIGRIENAINAINNEIQGMINKVIGQYDKLLEDFGINKALKFLDDIQKCIGGLCGAYNALKPYMAGSITDLAEFIKDKAIEKVNVVKKGLKNIGNVTGKFVPDTVAGMVAAKDQALGTVQTGVAKFKSFPILVTG